MGNRTVLAVLLNTVNHSYNNLPKGRGRNTWNECVKVEKKMLGLVKDDAHNREKWWRSLPTGNRPTLLDIPQRF